MAASGAPGGRCIAAVHLSEPEVEVQPGSGPRVDLQEDVEAGQDAPRWGRGPPPRGRQVMVAAAATSF